MKFCILLLTALALALPLAPSAQAGPTSFNTVAGRWCLGTMTATVMQDRITGYSTKTRKSVSIEIASWHYGDGQVYAVIKKNPTRAYMFTGFVGDRAFQTGFAGGAHRGYEWRRC